MTTFGNGSPRTALAAVSAALVRSFATAGTLAEATWGVRMTLSIPSSGLSGGIGSGSQTSSPAPPRRPDWRASIRAFVSTRSPRATLMKSAPGFIFARAARVDHPPRGGGGRAVQGDDVGGPQHLVEGHRHATGPLDLVLGNHRVEDDRHAPEGPQPLGHRPADAAEADDPDGQRLERVQRMQRGARPPPAAPDPVAMGDELPRQGQDQAERVVGDLVDAIIRDVADRDAPGPGRVEVDVIDPDAVADDRPGPAHRRDDPGVDRGELGDHAVRVGDQRQERVGLVLRVRPDDLAAHRLEDGPLDVERVECVIGDGDLHGVSPARESQCAHAG